jgi:CRISPR/Cas system-associated protein Cas10 (large subunit of type III CRISPR-Cas system)
VKKDPNYIAAVEKAIADKYGKLTVQDFRNDWEPSKEKAYLKQLKKVNATPRQKKKTQSSAERTCPVCKTYSFSPKDDLYMNRFKCCYLCYIDFAHGSEDKWADKWRPEPEQLAAALTRRKKNG